MLSLLIFLNSPLQTLIPHCSDLYSHLDILLLQNSENKHKLQMGLKGFVEGGIASIIAGASTHPLDLIKVRMQIGRAHV